MQIHERLKKLGRDVPVGYRVFLICRQCYRSLRRSIIQALIPYRRIPMSNPHHGLSSPLVVSLTSYPGRFDTLHLTVISILRQSIRPDRVVLWIAHEDMGALPEAVTSLKQYGLEVRPCQDLRSYKKIIPALEMFPDAFIVTADDDIYYATEWLAQLVGSYRRKPIDVICHRAHLITLDDKSEPRCYMDWEWHVGREMESCLLVPTGAGGVMYAPGIFDKRVTDASSFMGLCPTADDLWLYWMTCLSGVSRRVLRGRRSLISWAGSQEHSLANHNLGEKSLNDATIEVLLDQFGFPCNESISA